jgi:hypothetical protein
VTTLAIVTDPAAASGATGALRLLVGLVAGGHALRILEVGAARGALGERGDAGDEAGDYLRALAEFDVRPQAADGPALRAALRACDRVVRIGRPDRSGDPALLAVTEGWLDATPDEDLLRQLEEAGQVIRA